MVPKMYVLVIEDDSRIANLVERALTRRWA